MQSTVPKIVGRLDDVHIQVVIMHCPENARVVLDVFEQNDPFGVSQDNPTKEITDRLRFLPCILRKRRIDPVIADEEDGMRVDDFEVLDTAIETVNIVATRNTVLEPDISQFDNTTLENWFSLQRKPQPQKLLLLLNASAYLLSFSNICNFLFETCKSFDRIGETTSPGANTTSDVPRDHYSSFYFRARMVPSSSPSFRRH